MRIILSIFVGLFWVTSSVAFAGNHDHAGHHGRGHVTAATSGAVMAKTGRTAADRALMKVADDMHVSMDVPLMGPPDADFLRTMIPHHQGAIDMARVVIKYGKDPEVRDLAERIARTQGWEVGLMRRTLDRMGQGYGPKGKLGSMEKSADTTAKTELLHIHHAMHQAMDVPLTGNADCDFARSMIPHHQGAVNMAYWALGNGYHKDVQALARDIIHAQMVEIDWMQRWMKRKGCQ